MGRVGGVGDRSSVDERASILKKMSPGVIVGFVDVF